MNRIVALLAAWLVAWVGQSQLRDSFPGVTTSNGIIELRVVQLAMLPRVGKPENLLPIPPGVLAITLKNLSRQDATFLLINLGCQLRVDVRDSSGKEVPKTDLGERNLTFFEVPQDVPCDGISVHRNTLRPGKEWTFQWDLSRYFNFTPGGSYTVSFRIASGLYEGDGTGRPMEPLTVRSVRVDIPQTTR
jgi:hypothetical protein